MKCFYSPTYDFVLKSLAVTTRILKFYNFARVVALVACGNEVTMRLRDLAGKAIWPAGVDKAHIKLVLNYHYMM